MGGAFGPCLSPNKEVDNCKSIPVRITFRPGLVKRLRTNNNLIKISREQISTPYVYVPPNLLSNVMSESNSTSRSGLAPENNQSRRNFQNSKVKIAHLNIRSLRNIVHLTEVKELVKSNNIDILTISESWLNSSVTNREIAIDDYKLHRLDRLHKKGGGVCAYIKKNIKASVIKDLSKVSVSNFHQLWISLQCQKNKSIIICVTYRPPDTPLGCFEDLLKPNYVQALTLNKQILVLGDLNCNMLENGQEWRALTNVSTELNLTQIIKTPTRITATSQTLIDVILVSSTTLVLESGVINTSISDHLPVYVLLKLKAPKMPACYITTRSYKNYNPLLFSFDLLTKSDRLLSILSNTNVNTELETFKDVLHSTLDVHAPLKTFKIRNRSCPYVTNEIKELMKSRDLHLRRFQLTRDEGDWVVYKEYRNNVKTKIKTAAKDHTLNEVREHKHNSRSLWKVINNIIPSKEKETQVYSKDPKIVVEDFNLFFTSVGRNAAATAESLAKDNNVALSNPLSNVISYPSDQLFNFQSVNCTEVQRIIMAMPSNKSPGPDQIGMRVIKDCLPIILGPLTHIINSSLMTSTFPDRWKISEVIPLLKEGDHEIASNNRPLSLLEVVSKVCEKVALIQFSSYLKEFNRISSHQSGNRSFHSTETLNVFVTDTMLDAIDKKKLTALILLDLSKAFDSVSHSILLHKLSCIGASPEAVKWFQNYLSGRVQYVRIGSTKSSTRPITHGVPQGAILSPLLFCIYINDLPGSIQSCNLDSYVDDSKLYKSFYIYDLEQTTINLQADLQRAAKWCLEHQLLINPDKTKFLVVGSRPMLQNLPTGMSLTFLGKTIRPVLFAKDLGINLDSYLSYDDHISKLVSSCMRKLCQINRVKDSFDNETLKLVIETLVISKLLYCSTVWSNTSSNNINKLQSVQNFACRIITKTRKFDHVTPALRELNWLPVEKLLLYKDTVMAYKCFNGLAPDYLVDKFAKRSDIHDRSTRNHNLLDIPLYKTATGQRTFNYRGVKIWNDLDDKLKNITSITTFKKDLREFLLKESY